MTTSWWITLALTPFSCCLTSWPLDGATAAENLHCWETWILKLKPHTNSSGCSVWNNYSFFLFLLVVLEHNACFSFLFFLYYPLVSNQQGNCYWFCRVSWISSITFSSLFFCESTLKLWQLIRHHMAAHQTTFGLEQSFYNRKSFCSDLLKQMGWGEKKTKT